MSRDYFAKRLAKELGIPYAEALRRVRQAGDDDRVADPPAVEPPENVVPPA